VPTPDRQLDAVELILAAAAAETPDELAAARMAAIRSGRLREQTPATPGRYDRPAGVWLLGGLVHDRDAAQTVAARIGRISRRAHGVAAVDEDLDDDPDGHPDAVP
jgi:hypothetical protein